MTLKALLIPTRKPARPRRPMRPVGGGAHRLARFPAQSLRPGWRAAAYGRGLVGGVRRRAVPGDPLDMVAQPLLGPGQDAAFFLGSDSLGRDVAAGLAHGARVSLAVGAPPLASAWASACWSARRPAISAAGWTMCWCALPSWCRPSRPFAGHRHRGHRPAVRAHDRAGHRRGVLARDRAAGARRVPRCARRSSFRPRAARASATPGSSSARSCPMPRRRWW